MPIFKQEKNKLSLIKEVKIDLEKDLQKITEENLEEIFGLRFISTEFSLHSFRIDTLAFDEETSSFVIIEFKKDRSFSVVDQGFAYLSLMLNNKADFILEYNERSKNNLKRDDIDWSQSRVLFLAGSFTSYQQNAINFKDLPIELWEVKKYDNQTILYNQLKSADKSESINKISKNKTMESVSREIKEYTVSDHIKENWVETKELFSDVRDRILNLDSRIEESPMKQYIGYKIDRSLVVVLKPQKAKVILELLRVEPKDLKDPEGKVSYKEGSYGWYHKHISLFDIGGIQDIDYAMFLVKQVYEKFYK